QMIESAKQVFFDFIEWCKGLPGMILGAIGSIDLGSLFQLPDVGAVATGIGRSLGGVFGQTSAPANENLSGHRATGGPVWSGGTYRVNEREQEVFTPHTSGTVTPVSELGGNTVNVNLTV